MHCYSTTKRSFLLFEENEQINFFFMNGFCLHLNKKIDKNYFEGNVNKVQIHLISSKRFGWFSVTTTGDEDRQNNSLAKNNLDSFWILDLSWSITTSNWPLVDSSTELYWKCLSHRSTWSYNLYEDKPSQSKYYINFTWESMDDAHVSYLRLNLNWKTRQQLLLFDETINEERQNE